MNNSEKDLVGAILNHREETKHLLNELKPEHFTDPVYRDVFKCIQFGYMKKNKVMTHYDVGKVLEQEDTLKAIYNDTYLVSVSDAEYLSRKIQEEYAERELRNSVNQSKDSDELLKAAEIFGERVGQIRKTKTDQPHNMLEYIKTSFHADLAESVKQKVIKTGLSNYDDELQGLYAGLYVVGAISSLGKTTLMHQIADNIAGSGIPVLYFSLEMSTLELISKSISRISTVNALEQGYKGTELDERVNTSLSIRTKGIRTEEEKQAFKTYSETIAPNMNIIQGDFGTDVNTMRSEVNRFILNNPDKPKPVVFVDYLQIMKPVEDNRGNTKETVDYNVTELKRMSRDYSIPVVVISSFNRNNYMLPVSFESFKESGGIEYTADVVIGLQLAVLSSDIFNSDDKTKVKVKRDAIKAAKKENPRKIELQILKSRYGNPSDSVMFEYNSRHDLFVPAPKPEDTVFTVTAETPKGYKPNRRKSKGFNAED